MLCYETEGRQILIMGEMPELRGFGTGLSLRGAPSLLLVLCEEIGIFLLLLPALRQFRVFRLKGREGEKNQPSNLQEPSLSGLSAKAA